MSKNMSLTITKLKKIKTEKVKVGRPSQGIKSYPCPNCDYVAREPSKLKRHLTVHSSEKPFACSLCTFRTKRAEDLAKHRSSHTGEKPYHCHLCGYEAREKYLLNRHLVIHNPQKDFLCDHCDYKTYSKKFLKHHVTQVHNTTEMLQCDLCSFKTINKIRFRSHEIAHKKKTSFTCTKCDKTFLAKGDYYHHMKVHNPLRVVTFPCSICGERFNLKKDRTSHLVQEHKWKGYPCRLCGLFYSDRRHLKEHHQKTHPNEAVFHCSTCDYYSDDWPEYRRHLSSVAHLENVPVGC